VTATHLTQGALRSLPSHTVVVRKGRFRLVAYQRERAGPRYGHVFSCRIAIGAPGHLTPSGPHILTGKECPPTYTAPNEDWARDAGYAPGVELAPDDPANPIRGAFLWLGAEGVGIHGTPNLLSLGTRASHGCIRVRAEDAVTLYRLLPLGSQVVVL
jgi:lipoprotein-anchoring transpeptidase ErfK/SrfK